MKWLNLFLLILNVGWPVNTRAGDPESHVQFFGVASHFLHTRQIYTDKDDSWLVTKTAPIQRDLANPWVTEQIYALTSKSRALVDDGTANTADKFRIEQRRKLVDEWLSNYDRAGTRVLLTIMAAAPRARNANMINEAFGDWIAELVARHPAIKVVQLHNEPNLKSFWPDKPSDYVDVYRPIARKINQRNPQVAITVGAISSLSWQPGRKWLTEAIKAGLLDFADGVSVHPYNLKSPPELDPHLSKKGAVVGLRDGMMRFWREIKAAGPAGKELKLYLTELGYSSAPNGIAGIGSEEVQANYLARLMMLYVDFRLRDNIPIEAVFWYDLKNDGPDPLQQEDNFGLVSADLTRKKPAFLAYQNVISLLPDVALLRASSDQFTTNETNVVITPWLNPDAEYIVGLWRTDQQRTAVSVSFQPTSRLKSLEAEVIDVLSGEKTTMMMKSHGASYSLIMPDFMGVKVLKIKVNNGIR